MTSEEWVASLDPLIVFPRIEEQKPSSRKMRLASVACCRCIWERLTDERSRAAVDAAEIYADDRARVTNCGDLEENASLVVNTQLQEGENTSNDASAAAALCLAFWAQASWGTFQVLRYTSESVGRIVQMSLLNCIFGIPHRRRTADRNWLTPTAVAIATALYADRAFDRMPILADALEEAGCTNADVLLHCRGDGPHVRGCWVVDSVLGKE